MIDLDAFAGTLDAPSGHSWRPVILRLLPGEMGRFTMLCRRQGIAVIDTIDRQLTELAAVRLPDRPGEHEQYAREVAGDDVSAYGAWVHLPWLSQVAHVLPPSDYFDVVTARNQLKITRAEQDLLRKKRVAVIGLSVGGEVAVALAQEHLCGHIVLADHDRLDLSNLNRLGAGIHDLGLPKTQLVARRIAVIDPYLEITLVEEGVTEDNAAEFMDGLDLLVDECDGLAIKHLVRRLARDRGVDVVYAADERGFLSVEPYGGHPGLEPFHGLVAGRPEAYLDGLVSWLGGREALSERSRRSAELIGTSLSGYPQLAGEARYAAGQVAHVARRLLLGERLPPFHGHLGPGEFLP
ncbi:hypothetical protein GCM10023196_072410 [Actinoallomurus vinaceus]|uniref:THIF-type NAD/FAD binding fold domain-containing protein n=2 Tax=Actinoallomurus vinaceus TaxID=1080074 RepID=A0ABP8UK08_9ACTN